MLRLEELANVALRVPSILVLDLLYKCDIEGLTDRLKAKNEDMLFKYKYLIWNMYYIGKFLFCFFCGDLQRQMWSQFLLSRSHFSMNRNPQCWSYHFSHPSACLFVLINYKEHKSAFSRSNFLALCFLISLYVGVYFTLHNEEFSSLVWIKSK